MRDFTYHKDYKPGTRNTYAQALDAYIDWCHSVNIDPSAARPGDINAHIDWLRSQGLAQHTVSSRVKYLRVFYAYLVRERAISENPLLKVATPDVDTTRKAGLTLEELWQLWKTTEGRDRVLVGLLGVCALRLNEIRVARVEHIGDRQGSTVLEIPTRRGPNDLGFVVVPAPLAVEIYAYLAGRKKGLIFPSTSAHGVDKKSVNRWLAMASKRGGLQPRVTTLALSYSLRQIAIAHGFPYASVLRTASHGSVHERFDLIRKLDLRPEDHASVRLMRLLSSHSAPQDSMLLQSKMLLSDGGHHPAVPALVAAATLERTMREMVTALGITVNKRDPSLSTYGSILRAEQMLSIGQLRTVERILSIRNDAAHGYFEAVLRPDAEWLVAQAGALIDDLRRVSRR